MRGSVRVGLTSVAAAALAAAGLAFGAGPAQAVPPTIKLTSPNASAPLTAATIHVEGQASMPQGGTVTGQLQIDVTSLDGAGGRSVTLNVNSNPVPFAWDYATSVNGRYRVTVTARGRDGTIDQTPSETAVLTRDVAVEVKPATPTGVGAKVGKGRDVVVSWNPNTEPDILGYQVQRRHGDDVDWTAAGNVAETTFDDTATTTQGGSYRYRVLAIRRGSTAEQGLASDPSTEQSVDVPNPPPTTTTTGRNGSGGSTGGAGGSGAGGSSGVAGSGQPGSAGSTSPELARTGKVDLSGFAGLLSDSKVATPKPGKGKEADGTFDETLPFKPGDEAVGEDGTALGVGIKEAGGGARGRKPIAFVAASLLVTVLLMHLLWLKREVERVPETTHPVLDPE
ncbi:MAG: hypothetical protein QOK43_987 [Acidimicrobiaceae bacterium]|nr:hypothetical protein [Acidimicrobiaceae bacterium]